MFIGAVETRLLILREKAHRHGGIGNSLDWIWSHSDSPGATNPGHPGFGF